MENLTLYDIESQLAQLVSMREEATDDLERQTIDEQIAEYLRLRSDVRLAFSASCDLQPKHGTETVDAFEKLGTPADLVIGGQQAVATLRTSPVNLKSEISNSRSPA